MVASECGLRDFGKACMDHVKPTPWSRRIPLRGILEIGAIPVMWRFSAEGVLELDVL